MKKLLLFVLCLLTILFLTKILFGQERKVINKIKYTGQEFVITKNTYLIGHIDSLSHSYVIDSIIYLEGK